MINNCLKGPCQYGHFLLKGGTIRFYLLFNNFKSVQIHQTRFHLKSRCAKSFNKLLNFGRYYVSQIQLSMQCINHVVARFWCSSTTCSYSPPMYICTPILSSRLSVPHALLCEAFTSSQREGLLQKEHLLTQNWLKWLSEWKFIVNEPLRLKKALHDVQKFQSLYLCGGFARLDLLLLKAQPWTLLHHSSNVLGEACAFLQLPIFSCSLLMCIL